MAAEIPQAAVEKATSAHIRGARAWAKGDAEPDYAMRQAIHDVMGIRVERGTSLPPIYGRMTRYQPIEVGQRWRRRTRGSSYTVLLIIEDTGSRSYRWKAHQFAGSAEHPYRTGATHWLSATALRREYRLLAA